MQHASISRRAARLRAALFFSCVATVFAVVNPVYANPYDTFGATPRVISMGGAGTAVADDAGAVYYNPALLTESRRTTAFLGFNLAAPMLSLNGADAPVANSYTIDLGLNLQIPFGGILANRFALGVLVALPTNGILRLPAFDDASPIYMFYDGRNERLVLSTAFSIRIIDELHIGAGVMVIPTATGSISLDISGLSDEDGATDNPAGTPENERQNVAELDIEYQVAPVVGIVAKPIPELRIGLTWRGEQQLGLSIPATIRIDEQGNTIGILAEYTAFKTPHTIALGVAYKPVSWTTITADVSWLNYKSFVIPAPQISVLDTSGAVIGVDQRANANLSDVFIPRVGVEFRPAETLGFAFRGGFTWLSSPVPPQTGRSNLLDADSFALAGGIGWHGVEDITLFDSGIDFDLAARWVHMAEFANEKQAILPGNPGYPTLTGGGNIVSFHAQLKVGF